MAFQMLTKSMQLVRQPIIQTVMLTGMAPTTMQSMLVSNLPVWSVNNLDCLDSDPSVYLGAAEICDGQADSVGIFAHDRD